MEGMVTKRFFLVLIFLGMPCIALNPPALLSFSAGAFDVLRSRHRTWEFSLEYQLQYTSSYRTLNFRPTFGFMLTAQTSSYLYAGINFDLTFHDFVVSPGFAAGWYRHGHGKDLGFPLEFRSCLECAWQWQDWRRLGVRLSHLSNASIGRRNPGEESLVLFYSIPIRKGFPFK